MLFSVLVQRSYFILFYLAFLYALRSIGFDNSIHSFVVHVFTHGRLLSSVFMVSSDYRLCEFSCYGR